MQAVCPQEIGSGSGITKLKCRYNLILVPKKKFPRREFRFWLSVKVLL